MKGSVPCSPGPSRRQSRPRGCARLDQGGRPALRLRTGDQDWVEGTGSPAASLAADPFELFRALSGRRSLDQVRALAWDGDPEPYLDLLAPSPLPPSPPAE